MTTPRTIPLDDLSEDQLAVLAEFQSGIILNEDPPEITELAQQKVKPHLAKRGDKIVPIAGYTREYDPAAWADALSTEQMDALGLQATTGYRMVNAFLRGGESRAQANWKRDEGYDLDEGDWRDLMGEVSERIDLIDAAFESSQPLPEDTQTYRGLILPEDFTPEVGATFSDKSYVSTSDNLEAAEEFSTYYMAENVSDENGVQPERLAVVTVKIPAGTKVVDMKAVWNRLNAEDHTLSSVEQETLLNRGTTFVITEASTDDEGRWRLTVEAR